MQTLLDPKGFGEASRGVKPEIVVETGHKIPLDTEVDPTLTDETIGEELARLESAMSDAFIATSAATEEDNSLTPAEEARFERLMEIHNRTEVLRIMGLSQPETAR